MTAYSADDMRAAIDEAAAALSDLAEKSREAYRQYRIADQRQKAKAGELKELRRQLREREVGTGDEAPAGPGDYEGVPAVLPDGREVIVRADALTGETVMWLSPDALE